MNKKQSICEVDRKNNRVFENTYFMMVVLSWSTMCNDRIETEVRA